MTQHSDIERLLDHWFKDGPDQAPDRVVDIVTDRIERQSQRPAWRLQRRPFSVNAYAKLAVAAAAVLIVAVVGYNLFPGSSTGVGGPAPTASPSVIPSSSPAASQGVMPLPDSILDAGTYTLDHIDGMTITVTVPDGWRGVPGFGLAGPNDYDAPLGLSIVFLQSTGAYDDPCHWDKAGTGNPIQPGEQVVGPTVDDLVADIRANTAYTSTTPTDVTIDGHPGKQVDLQLPSTLSFASCDQETGSTTGIYQPLIGGIYALGPGNIWHTRIVDVDGSRVVVLVTDYEGTPADVRAQAQTIIDSIKFTK
jgi:hypothetical protein